ncbi:hypothetical protein WJX72_008048 [[Myrmecia] bisecta]|uniref:Uncharacterized protein n=1 Tax=[Myrmecia] bisecta TaxID=41462 RepID=A0AAW1R7M4_9CHLO
MKLLTFLATSSCIPGATPGSGRSAHRALKVQAVSAENGAHAPSTGKDEAWKKNSILYEYGSAAKPRVQPIPVQAFPASLHQTGDSRVVHLDLSSDLGMDYPATAPNMLASFVRIRSGDTLEISEAATSHAFYVIRGSGTSLYWVHDGPLLKYLGVSPTGLRFPPALYRQKDLVKAVEDIRSEPGAKKKNRIGVLLGNTATPQTKTLTHVLWALFNILPAHHTQQPHKHSATALDLAVYAGKNVYTMMGPDINSEGAIVDPVRVEWSTGAMFTTPPGWWHSHHNEGDEDAWVMPIQDAGLFTHQRVLDIRFAPIEKAKLKFNRITGATFDGENIKLPGNGALKGNKVGKAEAKVAEGAGAADLD